jgi:hypothetical protein
MFTSSTYRHGRRNFHISLGRLACGMIWSAATRGWVNEASTFDAWSGTDSKTTLTTTFTQQ